MARDYEIIIDRRTLTLRCDQCKTRFKAPKDYSSEGIRRIFQHGGIMLCPKCEQKEREKP
jgi:Zn finger protein HypA/HybF involved in hydrogenase expression